jgi:ABC-type molybdenum transport system ATPase subunit/photorepair protein PhrA
LLAPAWRTGTAEEVGGAMQDFIKEIYPEVVKAMPSTITADKKSAWMQQVAAWIYSTDHIEMKYSITYDGVAIEQLSPGTRGIVLLLLYLVIDSQDHRPLIIDQPEENLDPKSVFEELVPHFRNARKRRQVIIVTHNANLVVNTDADQVIVALSEPNPSGGLLTVVYRSGSIENPEIRKTVCEILEGGEQAFLDRERRYRLQRRSESDD